MNKNIKGQKNSDAIFTVTNVNVNSIIASASNPRTTFNESDLRELADSIEHLGLQQPIKVRPVNDNKYEIVYGERRFRAHILLERTTIPAIIEDMNDEQAYKATVTENLNRRDLSPIQEGQAYKILKDKLFAQPYQLKCYNAECLENKVFDYLTGKVADLAKENPGLPIESAWNAPCAVVKHFEKKEIEVCSTLDEEDEMPERPEEPLEADYDDESKYNSAINSFLVELEKYEQERTTILDMEKKGKYYRRIVIFDNDVAVNFGMNNRPSAVYKPTPKP